MSDHTPHADSPITATIIGALLGFLMFGSFLYLVIDWNAASVIQADKERVAERTKIHEEVLATGEEELQKPWIDKAKGIPGIPIDRAMELTIQELKNKPIRPGSPAEPQPSLIVPPPPQP